MVLCLLVTRVCVCRRAPSSQGEFPPPPPKLLLIHFTPSPSTFSAVAAAAIHQAARAANTPIFSLISPTADGQNDALSSKVSGSFSGSFFNVGPVHLPEVSIYRVVARLSSFPAVTIGAVCVWEGLTISHRSPCKFNTHVPPSTNADIRTTTT